MNVDNIMALGIIDLRQKLEELGIDSRGRKDELRERLIGYYNLDFTDATDEAGKVILAEDEPRELAPQRNFYTLKDLEDSFIPFDGTGSPDISQWLSEFEETATIVKWTQLQMFVYGKQLLKGAARLYIRSQIGIKDWKTLKAALKEEFGTTLSAAEVHRILRNRRLGRNESLLEYLYAIMELGKHICLDEASVIEYFINGINDSNLNKAVLYQAKNIKSLKEQIKVYEKIRTKPGLPNRVTERSVTIENKKEKKKCYKCGDENHLANSCQNGQYKCFKCNQLGHRSFECKSNKSNKVSGRGDDQVNMVKGASTLIFKDIKFGDKTVSALIDTGCDICLMRSNMVKTLGGFNIINEKIKLHGIGESEIETIGCFVTKIEIDEIEFEVTFYVVSGKDINHSVMIGNSLLSKAEVVMKKGEAYFKIPDEIEDVKMKNDKLTNEFEDVNVKDELKGVKIKDEFKDVKRSESQDEIKYSKRKDGNRRIEVDDVKIRKCDIEHGEVDKDGWFSEFARICMAADTFQDHYNVDLSHLRPDVQDELKKSIENYKPRRISKPSIEMKIVLKDDIPVSQRPRRMAYSDQAIVDKQIEDWLKEGIIRPSCSEYTSPVVLVPKKDGEKRLCCDYRRLNAKIIRDNFPMPLMDEVIDKLQGARVYTTLDLVNGFFHVPIEESSRKYTSFVTNKGQYEFLYVPFGISNSPAVFTRFISVVLRDLIYDGTIVVYMDDIIIPSKDVENGLKKLQLVLGKAAEKGLQIKWRKCQFLQTKVKFLGYEIENGSIKPSEEKTVAVKRYPVPKDRQAVQRFLGLTSYFRRFVKDYAIIAKPLSDMLRKDVPFKLNDEALLAFQQLKNELIKAPILRLFSPNATTEVHTDASKYGYGGVLMQKDSEDQEMHPVQYMSRKTKPYEERYHSYELEILAVIEALKKWRIYLLGIPFKIVTDCSAFKMTMNKNDVPPRVARWAMFLQEFSYEIEHRPANKMKHVDALSRVNCLLIEGSLFHRLREAQNADERIRAIKTVLKKDNYDDFYIKGELLYKDPNKELIVVPEQMEEEIIRIAHRQGHFSAKRTQDLVEKQYYIPKLYTKVEKVTKNCVECIIVDAKAGKREGLLNPIDKDCRPLMTYHLDHVGPMATTNKSYNHILVIVDAFTKFVWLYPTKSTDAKTVIESLEKQASIFGNPSRIITDRGTAFTAKMFEDYCKDENIQHLTIATGVPRGNGQVERMHKIIVPMLSKLCREKEVNWYKYIRRLQMVINSTPTRSTCYSPFRLLTGVEMKLTEYPDLRKILDQENIDELDNEREIIRTEARKNIAKIQAENCKTYNKRRKPEEKYAVNDVVAIKRTQFSPGLKLKSMFLGPYKVTKAMEHGRYEVEKLGNTEGPNKTVTVAENMKRWSCQFGANCRSGSPDVGDNQKRTLRTRRNIH